MEQQGDDGKKKKKKKKLVNKHDIRKCRVYI